MPKPRDPRPPEAPAETYIREEAFAPLLAERGRTMARLLARLVDPCAVPIGKEHFAELLRVAEELESFLDDCGARWNRVYAPVTELVAGVRSLAGAGFHLTHVLRRISTYRLADDLDAGQRERWKGDAHGALEATRGWVLALGAAALEALVRNEAQAGGTTGPPVADAAPAAARPASVELPKLPRTLDQDEPANEEQRIARVATDFLDAARECRRLLEAADEPPAPWVRRWFSEASGRTLTVRIQNLQSRYDTWIGNTVLEARDPRLPCLRGHASLAVHLLQAAAHLVHFRERYESDERAPDLVESIARQVPPTQVDGLVRDRLVLPAAACLVAGATVAAALVPSYTNVQERVLVLPEGVRVHARPAALIANVVQHHGTPVEMEVAGRRCNAASILELLVALGEAGEATSYTFRGDEKPLDDLEALFAASLGELGLDALPPSLAYLRG